MAAFNKRSFALTPERRALLDSMLTRPTESPSLPTPRGRKDGEPIPMSFAQERLWFLDQFQPGLSIYNMPFTVRPQHAFDAAAMERTLNEIIRRHEVLRTTFHIVQDKPAQLITPHLTLSLPIVDLRTLPEAVREQEVQRLFMEAHHHVFDLVKGPLFQATLLRVHDNDDLLLMNMHHIVSDGWSMGILMRELSVIYDAYSHGRPSPLPDLTLQYADYALEQRGYLAGGLLTSELSYWREQLKGAPPVLDLPTDRPRPAQQTFNGETLIFRVSASVTDALVALGREVGVTLFMTLIAAFKTLLYHYSGQEHVVVGTPIANRNRTEIEGLIGFFVNTLLINTDLSGNPSFRDLLGRVREVTLGAYAHQDLPFEKLVEELQPNRNLNQNPLFQVLFALQNMPTTNAASSAATDDELRIVPSAAKFDLSIFMGQTDNGLVGELEYNVDLFDRSRAIRIVRHFQTLLESIVAQPDQRLLELPLLTATERLQLLIDWNATTVDFPQDACVHHLVQAQVANTPDACAVVFNEQRLTYKELDMRASLLAQRLRKLGVGPDVRVAICVDRSLEMFIAVLATLKAGGAYVPLDPAYPKERLSFMAEDSQIHVLLTQKGISDRLPPLKATTVYLDEAADDAQSTPDTPAESHVSPENLAYVIYTSGSTGRPKGVAMPHRPLVNLIKWQTTNAPDACAMTTLQFASLSFDVSFQEMFTTWCSGGTLVVVDDEVRRDPGSLLRHIIEAKVERLFLPPVVLQQLAQVAASQDLIPTSLREVIVAGEALKITQPVAAFFAKLTSCLLRNHYGPTESHVVTEYVLQGDPQSWPALPPIGKPIANARIYILNPAKQPVPPGIPGELHIGGLSLARGYLDRPDLTAEKFIPDMFSDDPNARLYRTGDQARYRADGQIEFIGRVDFQVKVRGYRIETGEVEAVLRQHPAVAEAVVIAWENDSGDKQLVAYVVARADQTINVNDLRRFMKEKLPEYMVASAVVQLDALPLSPNGKVDRRALPAPEASRSGAEGPFVAPRNFIEEGIVSIWRSILGSEQIGVHDSFFDLGGHSLMATQIMSRLQESFGVSVPLRRIFEVPSSVADLAVAVVEVLAEKKDRGVVARILDEVEQTAASAQG